SSTSPPTTSTCPPSNNSNRPSTPTQAPCSWSPTTAECSKRYTPTAASTSRQDTSQPTDPQQLRRARADAAPVVQHRFLGLGRCGEPPALGRRDPREPARHVAGDPRARRAGSARTAVVGAAARRFE